MPINQYGPGDEPIRGSGYRIVSFLGRGGFGEVWKARAPGGSEVALKIIRLGSREGRKEFRALQLVKRIRHPNLIPIFAFWLKTDSGQILDEVSVQASEVTLEQTAPGAQTIALPVATSTELAQELVIAMGLADKAVSDRLTQCQHEGLPGIPQDELMRYMEDSAAALDFLNHPVQDADGERPAVQHCDIKPQNLLIVGGCVQVGDFGLARMIGSNRATTAAGSLAYAAPESLIENKPSFSTDQYSLAITYYELKAGKLPFEDLSVGAVLDAKRDSKLDFAALSAAERAVVKRATLRNPEERYATCREMVAALRGAALCAGNPRGRKSWTSVVPWLLAFLVLAAAAGGAWVAGFRPWTHGSTTTTTLTNGPATVPAAGQSSGPSPAKPPSQAPVPSPQSEAQGEAHLERGTQALRNRDFASAVSELEQAATLLPGNAKVFSRLGAAFSGQQRWDKAVESFTAAIQIEHHPLDYEARGQAYREMHADENAIANFRSSVELDPKNAKAYAELADIYLKKDDPQSAVREITKALEICQADPNANLREFTARHVRAFAYLTQGKTDQAAADLERIYQLAQSPQDRTDSHDLLYALSGKFDEEKRDDEAVRWIKRAIEFAPTEEIKSKYREDLKSYSAALKHKP